MKELRLNSGEFKAVDEMVIEGYPIVFESPATWGFTEIIDRRALERCDMNDIPLKYNHLDSFLIIARTRNKSLELTVDERGLKMRAELIDTQSNKDIFKSIKSGLLDKMSFAFTCNKEEYDYETNTRRILEIDRLYDVSVVDFPFYDATSVSAVDNRSLYVEKIKQEERKRLLHKVEKEILLKSL